MTYDVTPAEIELWANDLEDTEVLYAELSGAVGITVKPVSASIQPDEQDVSLALLTVALSSGAITTFLQIIKTLAEARGPRFVLSIRRGKNRLKITADNIDEVESELRRLLGGILSVCAATAGVLMSGLAAVVDRCGWDGRLCSQCGHGDMTEVAGQAMRRAARIRTGRGHPSQLISGCQSPPSGGSGRSSTSSRVSKMPSICPQT